MPERIHRVDGEIGSVRLPPVGFDLLTVTISPKLYNKPPRYQLVATRGVLLSILTRYCKDYCVVVELTQDANVHYHAWYVLSDPSQAVYFRIALKKATKRNLGYHCVSKRNPKKSDADQRKDCHEYLIKAIRQTFRALEGMDVVINPIRVIKNEDLESVRTIPCGYRELDVDSMEYNEFNYE